MTAITNIAAYRFASLTDLASLRESLRRDCRSHGLRGTILLSPEGINLFVAGSSSAVEWLLDTLRKIPGLAELTAKYSTSETQPFRRMLVRIKREIIAFGVTGIDPAERTSPRVSPAELKQWLDQGQDIVLLDTRNDYEVKLGTFRGAKTLPLRHFRNFPSAVQELPDELRRQRIVTFCTGGIRCEKAAPYLESVGFEHVYQLDGGILKYFEECGAAHYDGDCFVFDQRVGLDPALEESDNALCFRCLAPLTAAEKADPLYRPGESCPHCYRTAADQAAALLSARWNRWQQLVNPLPGSIPYDNQKPINIPGDCAGLTLAAALGRMFRHVPAGEWEQLVRDAKLCDRHLQPADLSSIVQPGEVYLRLLPATVEPPVSVELQWLHEDEALVVVNKPAPLPIHPCGRFNRNTLQNLLNLVYAPQKMRPAHRLDADTTGVMVLTRSRQWASQVQPQFEQGLVRKKYLARVHGHPSQDRFCCEAPIGDEPILQGARRIAEAGQHARTEFTVLQRFNDNTTLLEVIPITGRTNQIRLHLQTLQLPIVGDSLYGNNTPNNDRESSRLCLHAWELTLRHPRDHDERTFVAPPPAWAEMP